MRELRELGLFQFSPHEIPVERPGYYVPHLVLSILSS